LEKALAVLTKHCGPDSDPYLAIAAWNALDYLDDRAKSVSDQLRAISPKQNSPPKNAGGYSITLKNKIMADLRRRSRKSNIETERNSLSSATQTAKPQNQPNTELAE
jgi:hypothetical protein